MVDSRDSFVDEDWVQYYETVSTMVIVANQGPIIVKNNTFSENIGTVGGTIFIMSPDFEANKLTNTTSTPNSKPYIYVRDNSFTSNMAYFAGNALYVAHTANQYTPYADYLNMCGSGVDVEANLFEENVGLRKHNGGAAVHRCIPYYVTGTGFGATLQTSSYPLELRNKTDADLDSFTYYYEDPSTMTDIITDIYDSTVTYTVLKYATKITNNVFRKNYAGMKGSALVLSYLSEL